MNDYSALVQWIVVALGITASLWIGWIKRGPRKFGKVAACAGLAVVLGLVFTFVAVYANSLCRTELQLCQNRGDGNMAYWFLPFAAIPAYWLLMLAFGTREEQFTFTPSPFDQAVDAALAQFRTREKIYQRCPNCKSVLSVAEVAAAVVPSPRRLSLGCACGRCDRVFDLSDERA